MNRVALVTGASSGIGAATARRLARAGLTVYGAARRLDRLAELAADGVRAVELDVTSDDSMTAAVDHVLSEAGRIDVLVNNAGYGSYGAIEDVPMAEARRQIEVNLFGLARMIQLVVPGMRGRGGGTIVNITSIGGKITTPLGRLVPRLEVRRRGTLRRAPHRAGAVRYRRRGDRARRDRDRMGRHRDGERQGGLG